ncbi:MAG: PqiC family protein [Rubrivivax sp.]|nr:PqiC family protein [Rubrivivax sp.]
MNRCPPPQGFELAAGWAARWAAGLSVVWLAGCASPLPALQWVRLPAEPAQRAAPVAASPASASTVWQLMAPVGLPGHLDRDALLLPQGRAGLQPLGGARWAEPLREAVPRLLRQDLARALGAEVWAAPLPPGLRATQQLRIELLAFDITADGRGVALQARWSMADATGATPPRLGETAFVSAASGSDADALAAAHRQALATLAARVAASAAR